MDYKINIVIDTREKRNELIIDALEKQGIGYCLKKLDFGDYSAEVWFSDSKWVSLKNDLCFERKRELTELSNTIWQGVDRFKREMELASRYTKHKKLIIEDSNYYANILRHNYRTKLPPDLFLDRLYSLQNKYNFEIIGIDGALTASYIYRNIKQYVSENIEELYKKAK